MAEKYNYMCKVMTGNGVVSEKNILADSKLQVEELIRRAGEIPISIVEKELEGSKDIASIQLFQKKVKSKDLSIFCKQMHTMLHAGMPLIKALGVMSEQVEHPALKKTTKSIMEDVQKGFMFSGSMKKHKKIFPPLLISMVESGEMTGKQDEVLEKMAIHYQKEDKIDKKIKSAMIYPKFLTFLTILVVSIMLIKVLPTFVKIFDGSSAEIPAITLMVMNFSSFLVKWWWAVLLVIIVLSVAFKSFKATSGGKRAWDALLLKLPIVKGPVKKIATSRFTRTLSTLLSSGLPLLSSLQMSGKVTGNKIVEEGIDSITEDIKKGSKLSILIKQIKVFPPMLVSMISIGEESGALEDMLERTSDFYDEELEAALTSLVALIEPMMILIMGLIIGFIVVAMLLPAINMFKAFGG